MSKTVKAKEMKKLKLRDMNLMLPANWTLQDFMGDPALMAKYKVWRDDPVTQLLCIAISNTSRPRSTVNPEKAPTLLAEYVGMNTLLDMLLRLDTISANAINKHIEPTYEEINNDE